MPYIDTQLRKNCENVVTFRVNAPGHSQDILADVDRHSKDILASEINWIFELFME